MATIVTKIENIATPMAQVWRTRRITPLTPHAERQERIESGTWESLCTPLDRALSAESANALEMYTDCENLLLGNARCADYCGDRVQKSPSAMSPLADRSMLALRVHAQVKRRLSRQNREILAIFCAQQRGDNGAPSDAQMGLSINVRTSNAASEWRRAIVQAANALPR